MAAGAMSLVALVWHTLAALAVLLSHLPGDWVKRKFALSGCSVLKWLPLTALLVEQW